MASRRPEAEAAAFDILRGMARVHTVQAQVRHRPALLPFAERVDTVVRMCERGHADKMPLSHDAACCNDWIPGRAAPMLPNWHSRHIHNDVLPALRARGVTDTQIHIMLVDNPRRMFERQGAY